MSSRLLLQPLPRREHPHSVHGATAALPSIKPQGEAALLSEADIVNFDLTVNETAMREIAEHRAMREYELGASTSYRKLLDAEFANLRSLAAAMIEGRKMQRASEALSSQERLIRSLEFKLEKLRYGLAQPLDPAAIKHHEDLLAQARASSPEDPAVRLAAMLEPAPALVGLPSNPT